MNKRLRVLLISATLLATPFINMRAFEWSAEGTALNANGYAITSGSYDDGDRIFQDYYPSFPYNSSFDATPTDSVLDIYSMLYTSTGGVLPRHCSLKIDGDVVLSATNADMTVNVWDDNNNFVNATYETVLEPYISRYSLGRTGAQEGYSQVVFQTGIIDDVKTHITVNLYQDLVFSGTHDDAGTPEIRDMIVTFKGPGTTTFRMYDGTAVKFDGELDTDGGIYINDEGVYEWYGVSSDVGKTRVYVTMDQTQGEVDNGEHKLVFERAYYDVDDANRVMVYFGYNSFLTYLSDNWEGDPDFVGERGGCGSIGFDPSNTGAGRMVLFLKGAYFTGWQEGLEDTDSRYWWIVYRYPMNDAAIVVAGNFVEDFDPATISHPDSEQEFYGVDLTIPAGFDARFDVLDNQYYNGKTKPLAYDVNDSRGLLVVNDVQNHGKLASDPYLDFWNSSQFLPGRTFEGPKWSWFLDPNDPERDEFDFNTRRGFVIGINGKMGVYDNAFLDYTCGSVNQPDAIAWFGTAGQSETDYTPDFDHGLLKKRNPAALIIDNVDASLYYAGTTEDPVVPYIGYVPGDPFLDANNPYYNDGINDARHAQIELFGNARVYFKNSASSYDADKYGYVYNFWGLELENDDYNPVDDIEMDWDAALSVGEPDDQGVIEQSAYDGYYLEPNFHTLVEGEGEHVLDVEGKLSAKSFYNTALYGRSSGYMSELRLGTIAMSSVLRDYTGQELNDGGYISRPLLTPALQSDALYTRYNSPAFFFNTHAQLFDTILRHDDASKYVDGIPYDSDPAYTGGEVMFFSFEMEEAPEWAPDRQRLPELRYFNSTFEVHESACLSGIRQVIKDIPGLNDEDGSNLSVIKFYDHGDILDSLLTKHGRIFQLSSMYNKMSDGTSNYATESAQFNVYKGNYPERREDIEDPDTSATIKLSLQREGEYPTTGGIDPTPIPTGHDYTKEIAHNLFLLSVPDASVGAACRMLIGWTPNIIGDLRIPSDIDVLSPVAEQGGYPYEDLPMYEDGDWLFNLNALDEHYPAAPAVVSIDGDLITFGGFDQYGESPLVPVVDYTDNGVIQIAHGGKMMITRPEDTGYKFDRTSVPYQTFIDTMAVKTIWNNFNIEGTAREVWYGGVFDVPHDQVTYGKNFGLQVYGITADMFAARDTDGYVRVDFNNENRTIRADKTGDEEVVWNWFKRDANPKLSETKGLKRLKRVHQVLRLTQEIDKVTTKATESVYTVIQYPDPILYIGAPDDITQFRVAGATMADPFRLDVSGYASSDELPQSARVREFVTQPTTNGLIGPQHFIGEGAHAVLYGEYGGVIGLGSRSWNELSLNAWNLIGKDYVSIAPLGDMTVELNSNLIVTDRLPFIATDWFGEVGEGNSERLTFYSALPLEIRVPAGFELDLSAFGKSSGRQEIEFAGNVRLVLEDGASIRFPSYDDERTLLGGGLVLYFNDDSQLIFEGLEIPGTYQTAEDTNYDLIKILGEGQIWLNKNAKMLVNGDVRVGVMADTLTPTTDVTISIKRHGSLYIGTKDLAGGTLQVGNPTHVPGTSINFGVLIDGPDALFETNREGFFGLGAGILNRSSEKMNGDADPDLNPELDEDGKAIIVDGYPSFTPAEDAWTVVQLFDLNNVKIEVTQGAIQHNNMFNGSDGNAALWAIGQASKYTLNLNSSAQAIIRGGGNLMVLPSFASSQPYPESFYVKMWDFAGQLNTLESYSIVDSAPSLVSKTPVNGLSATFLDGRSVVFTTDADADLYAAANFFNHLAFQPFNDKGYSQVCISRTLFDIMVSFVNYDVLNEIYPSTMTRITTQVAAGSVKGNLPSALNFGAIDGEKCFADPTLFTSNWPVQ